MLPIRGFKINLLNIDVHHKTNDFINTIYSYSLFPQITKPTRVTKKSATLIDNIFTNGSLHNQQSFSGVLFTDITDHFPVFHIIHSNATTKKQNYIRKRIYSEKN